MPWSSQQPQPITVWWGLRGSISAVFVLGFRFSWMSISQLCIACGVPSLLSLSPPLPFPQVEPPSYLPPVLFPSCQCLLPERSVSFPSEDFRIKYEIKYEVTSLDHSVLFMSKLGLHFLILQTSVILIRIWGSEMLEVRGWIRLSLAFLDILARLVRNWNVGAGPCVRGCSPWWLKSLNLSSKSKKVLVLKNAIFLHHFSAL